MCVCVERSRVDPSHRPSKMALQSSGEYELQSSSM